MAKYKKKKSQKERNLPKKKDWKIGSMKTDTL